MDAHLRKDRPGDLAERLSFDCPVPLLERLAARYGEPHRRYHTWAHVLGCFDARDRITDAAMPEVDLALLFHDAIYDPFAGDNEARSAELLLHEGRLAWLDERVLRRAAALVAVTKHGGDPDADDGLEACVVIDADLSILGAERGAFEQYEGLVRQEFSVDDETYAAGRSYVLRAFLARPSIYATRRGARLWEARARQNLEISLSRMSGAPRTA
jgi:predicted metal-dependent HD superfamily phosphohydrolase